MRINSPARGVNVAQNLTRIEQNKLLTLAREAIIGYVREETIPNRDAPNRTSKSPGLFRQYQDERALRGCIGSFISDKPLYKLVQEMAISAATRDPRFYPMKPADLTDFTLEISVLSPLDKISSPHEIKVGTHGIYIEKNSCRGVLLPQGQSSMAGTGNISFSDMPQGGLRPDDWKEGADLYIFSAQIVA